MKPGKEVKGILPNFYNIVKEIIGKPIKLNNKIIGKVIKAKQKSKDYIEWEGILFDKIELTGQTCRVCGCTQKDCSQCIESQGKPCYWVKDDLCSRCSVFVCAMCGYLHDDKEQAMECCSGEQ